jgi:hypothetical protein
MLKTVRGILNKLTPSNFETLLVRIQSLEIDSEGQLTGVIKLFYEKVFFGFQYLSVKMFFLSIIPYVYISF